MPVYRNPRCVALRCSRSTASSAPCSRRPRLAVAQGAPRRNHRRKTAGIRHKRPPVAPAQLRRPTIDGFRTMLQCNYKNKKPSKIKYLVSSVIAAFVIATLAVSTALAESPTTLYTSSDCSGPTYMPPPWGQPPIQMLPIGSSNDGGKCTTLPPFPMLVGVPPAKSPTDPSGNNRTSPPVAEFFSARRCGSSSDGEMDCRTNR